MLLQVHQASWKEDFNKVKAVLNTALEGLDICVEHIGSTAVPDLAAKAIIDIDIVFYAPTDFAEIKERLAKIGYYHNGDQGIQDREVFKRKKATAPYLVLDDITHHLYVCPSHSEELKRHLAFRDFLIQNEAARKEYQAIKYEIAEAADQDKKRYAKLKEDWAREFVLSVLRRAG
ncbi:MAG: GrpB family protein [Bacteroidota bacterium]